MDDGLRRILDAGTAMNEAEAMTKEAQEEATPSLAEIIVEIENILDRYIVFPEKDLSTLVSLWICGTYTYESFHYYGYLAVRSATPRCGKTRLLSLISLFANGNPPITAVPTAAALFRSNRPVLILDEVDKLRNQDKETYGEVLAVLNAGFEAGAVVQRVERMKGEGFITKEYPVYGPKALAGIEGLADTLSDRSFQIQMKRATQRTPRLNVRRLKDKADRIRKRLELWASQYEEQIRKAYDALPDEVDKLAGWDDRFQDVSEPLMVLSGLADAQSGNGNGIVDKLSKGLKAAAGQRKPSGREKSIIEMLNILEDRLDGQNEIFIHSTELVDECKTHDELGYIETAKKLSGLLERFDLFPRPDNIGRKRGYLITKEWLMEWRARYPKNEGNKDGQE